MFTRVFFLLAWWAPGPLVLGSQQQNASSLDPPESTTLPPSGQPVTGPSSPAPSFPDDGGSGGGSSPVPNQPPKPSGLPKPPGYRSPGSPHRETSDLYQTYLDYVSAYKGHLEAARRQRSSLAAPESPDDVPPGVRVWAGAISAGG